MTNNTNEYFLVLDRYVKLVNKSIELYTEKLGPESLIRDACVYALSTGGKRLRPTISLMVADALQKNGEAVFAALSTEFFHTASLVVDDMPSMDDDDLRRSLPSVHKKFGEGTALLVSYALIGAGYDFIAKNAEHLLDSSVSFAESVDYRCRLVLENAAYNTGLNGATGGQFMDIHPPDLSIETVKQIIHLKTSSLFEISFVSGWLFGGGDIDKLPKLKKAASHYGLAFQIADDLGDQEQDLNNERAINLANVIGRERAVEMFHGELDSFVLIIKEIGVFGSTLNALAESLRGAIGSRW